jgi:hypothetical protein
MQHLGLEGGKNRAKEWLAALDAKIKAQLGAQQILIAR